LATSETADQKLRLQQKTWPGWWVKIDWQAGSW